MKLGSTIFYDIWAGKSLRPKRFRANLCADLNAVFDLLLCGATTAPVAATFPLTEAVAAMTLAEPRTMRGKVVLVPSH